MKTKSTTTLVSCSIFVSALFSTASFADTSAAHYNNQVQTHAIEQPLKKARSDRKTSSTVLKRFLDAEAKSSNKTKTIHLIHAVLPVQTSASE